MEWDRIPVEECQKLIESMPGGFRQCLKQKEAIPSTDNIQIPFFIQKLKNSFYGITVLN